MLDAQDQPEIHFSCCSCHVNSKARETHPAHVVQALQPCFRCKPCGGSETVYTSTHIGALTMLCSWVARTNERSMLGRRGVTKEHEE